MIYLEMCPPNSATCVIEERYYTEQACLTWQDWREHGTQGTRGDGLKLSWQCVNDRGEKVTASVTGCYFGRSASLGDDGTGDGKAAGTICPTRVGTNYGSALFACSQLPDAASQNACADRIMP